MCEEMRHAGGERVPVKRQAAAPKLPAVSVEVSGTGVATKEESEKGGGIIGGVKETARKVADVIAGKGAGSVPAERHLGAERVTPAHNDSQPVKPPVKVIADKSTVAGSETITGTVDAQLMKRLEQILTEATRERGKFKGARTSEAKAAKAAWQYEVLLRIAEALKIDSLSQEEYDNLGRRSLYLHQLQDQIRKMCGQGVLDKAPGFIINPPQPRK